MSCRTRMNVFNQNPLVDWYPLFSLLSDNNSNCCDNDCDECWRRRRNCRRCCDCDDECFEEGCCDRNNECGYGCDNRICR